MPDILFETSFERDDQWTHHCKVFPVGGTPYAAEVGNIFVPAELDFYAFRHGLPVPHDPGNRDGWKQPEGHHTATYVDTDGQEKAAFPYRVNRGIVAWMCFGFFATIDGALVKTVDVPGPGTLTVTGMVHGWSLSEADESQPDRARFSTGVGHGGFVAEEGAPELTDAQRNLTFWVGIDATNGDDPFAESVQWGQGYHIYNAYAPLSASFTVDKAGPVKVFWRGANLWRFKHNDQYWDDLRVTFEPQSAPPPPPPEDPEPEQYDRYVIVADPNLISQARVAALYAEAGRRLRTITVSHNDANPVTLPPEVRTNTLEIHGVTAENVDDYRAYHLGRNPDTILIFPDLDDDPPPPPPPSGGESWTPHNYTPQGSKLSWHAVGDAGLVSDDPHDPTPLRRIYAAGGTVAAMKYVADVGAARYIKTDFVRDDQVTHVTPLDPGMPTIGRFIDHPETGKPLEGVSGTAPPEVQAEARMRDLKDLMEAHPYVDFWEITNEQDPEGIAGHEALARFYLRALEIAESWGVKIACFSYSVGVPEPEEWAAIAATGVFEKMAAGGHALALHEYDIFKTARRPNGVVVANGDPAYTLCRYRQVYRDEILPRKLDIPLYITEYAPVAWEEDLKGWTPEELWEQAVLYDREVRKDPYVAAVHIFSVGPSQWRKFHDLYVKTYDRYVDYVLAEADKPNGEVEPLLPPPPPLPQPQEPQVKAYSQRDPQWASLPLGPSSYTVGNAGCVVTAKASLFTMVDPTMDPKKLVTWLNANGGFTSGGLLYMAKPFQMPGIREHLRFINYHNWRDRSADLTTLRRLLAYGPTVVQVDFRPATQALDSHFVLALHFTADGQDLVIMDPWTGKIVELLDTYGQPGWDLARAVYTAVEYERIGDPPPSTTPTLLGLNDPNNEGGVAWLAAQGQPSLAVVPLFIGGNPATLDFSDAAAKGVRVIVNLRYSWSTDLGGGGTLPLPGTGEAAKFVNAAVSTIQQAKGVWGWEIGNEANNPREFPRNAILTPEAVAHIYNQIRAQVPGKRLAPGALDPFNAQAGDPRYWLSRIYQNIGGAEFVTAHGYIRGPDASLVGSDLKFADDPLRWQYLNYPGCITALLDSLPDAYRNLPVYVTEFNHLYKTAEGDWGWVNDTRAGDVVRAGLAAAKAAGLAGLAVYRWTGDAWAVKGNPHIGSVFA